LSTLYSKIDEGRQGNDKTIAQFEKLGITFGDLQKMNTYEAINKVAQGFKNVGDAFERTKMIKDFFGKGGIGLSIDQINEALSQGTARYDKYAEGIQAVGVVADNMKRSMDNLKIAVASMMKPFVGDNIISVERFEKVLKALAVGGIAVGVYKIAAAFIELGSAIWKAVEAGTAFNFAMGATSPIGLAIKLLAAGATAMIFIAGQQDNKEKIAKLYNDSPAIKDKLAKDAHNRLLFTKEPNAAGGTATAEDNPEVKARKAQVTLAHQLRMIDADRNKVNAEAVFLGETQTKLSLLDLSLKEKLAQIEAKRQADLVAARENTPEFRAQINALASEEVKTAQANTKAQKELAIATAQRAHELEQAAQSFRSIEHAQYEASTKAAEANSEERTAALYQMGKMADEQVRINKLANQRTEYEMTLLNLAPTKRQMLMEQYDLEARITEFVREQNKLGQDPELVKQRADAMRVAGEQTIALNQANIEAQRTFEYGWAQAYNNFVDQSTNAAARAGEIFNSITGNMSNAIDTFVRTGKLSFKDFTRSVIQDLIAIQMKAQAMALFRMALSSFGFTGGASVSMGGTAYGGGIPGAYADGGDPPVGRPSLVGERGPELFVPKSAGTIIPNNQLSSMMSGGQTINYNGPFIANMSAIDTQSGIQFLSKNKQAVWAANQSAQRSLPMSK
jgi:lambda family phage tail tape measure protein